MANTKLTAEQKSELKKLKADFNGNLVNNGVTTMAYKYMGNTVKFSLSVASPDENKFRPKVGAYHAIHRFNAGKSVSMAEMDFHDLYYMLFS